MKLYSDIFCCLTANSLVLFSGLGDSKSRILQKVLVCLFLPSAQNLTYEIILTLGQAFEVAYQLALQAQRTKQHQNLPVGPGSEVIETKSSRPVPKPRGSVRKSAVSWTQHTAAQNITYNTHLSVGTFSGIVY